jgi:hypothetical protein
MLTATLWVVPVGGVVQRDPGYAVSPGLQKLFCAANSLPWETTPVEPAVNCKAPA